MIAQCSFILSRIFIICYHTLSVDEKMHAWWRTADFGFVKEVQDDLATVCEAHDQVYDHNSQTWCMCNNFELVSVPVYKSINKLAFVGSDAIKYNA